MKITVTRTDGVIKVLLLPHEDGSGYSYVNLTKGHICPCKFRTIEEALQDMDKKPNVIKYDVEDDQ